MGNSIVKGQLKQAKETLTDVVEELTTYLNNVTLADMNQEVSEEKEGYYASILASLRRMTVFSVEGVEACRVIEKAQSFRKAAAEKTLYNIYHYTIEEFYNPRKESWYEDSRAAYTGKNAIKFPHPVPESLKKLFANLEAPLQSLREELEFYETDYQTKIVQTKD